MCCYFILTLIYVYYGFDFDVDFDFRCHAEINYAIFLFTCVFFLILISMLTFLFNIIYVNFDFDR